jgi:mono/diheme cytochrome c family protein
MITRLFRNRFLGVLFAMFAFWNIALAGDPAAGKTLFINNCASCHAKDMKTKSTGPALAGLEERWAAYPKTDLYSWIRNSTALIAKGHPRATELWNAYKPTVMNSFTTLKDDEIENILAYIKQQAEGGDKKVTATNATTSDSEDSGDNTLFYGAILAVLAILALVLSQLTTRLNAASYAKDGIDKKAMTLGEILRSKSVVTFAIFGLIVLGGYTTVNNAIAYGRQQGYAPDQPIKFSHATHAGEQKIDCQYCHDAARRSKHASIPATNTCMNCHAAIKVGSKYGTAELTKIYASIGYDPSTGKYIPNYENMSEDQVAAIYKKWIGENYTSSRTLTSLDKGGELLVANQWEGIKSSLTNELKGKIQGSIEWTRVHSLPDHVYFNHSQHVSIGKVACQTCHGKVENMEVMAQHSPLSMGWCINCHRQTDVKFKDNAYYDSYKRYHDELKSGKRESVKVEEIGGLECQKCHY